MWDHDRRDVVDIGVFIVGLQFFAAMATVEEEDRVLFRGWFPCIQSIAVCVGGLFVNWLLLIGKSSLKILENGIWYQASRFRDQ